MLARLKLILIFSFLLIIALPISAQDQSLPPAEWYGVVWVRGDDTLHWISPNGEPASIARPKLPDELPNSNPQMRFSRDGRFMALSAELNSGVNGIGFYDIQAGRFTNTHQAQTGESIYLGRTHTSNLSATKMAVGFAAADFDNPAWRIIIFDLASGDPVGLLSNENASWEMGLDPSIPVITYYDIDESLGQEVIHFQMIAKVEAPDDSAPAFKWYPALTAPADMGLSPYDDIDTDINYLTGEIVTAYVDPAYNLLPPPESGLNYNAIGRIVPQIEDIQPTSIWLDETRYLYSPIWAKGGQWVAFFTEAGQEGVISGWQIVPRDGQLADKSPITLAANIREVMGTPSGLLMIDTDNRILDVTSLDFIEGQLLFQSPDAQLSQILFVSREPNVFTLANVADPNSAPDETIETPVADEPIEVEPISFCEGTPPSILNINAVGTVANTDGIPLRVRDAAGGNVLTEIVEGTQFNVIGGPECVNGYTWWEIEFSDSADATRTGWSAEGDDEGYFVEVLIAGDGVQAPDDTPELTPTDVMLEEEATAIDTVETEATAIPLSTPESSTETTEVVEEALVGDGDCSAAPDSRINVGMNVRVMAAGGTLAFRANPLDNVPAAQLPDQAILPVIGGPACRQGYRQWQVRANLDGSLRDGWVSEGTITRYFLEPNS